MPIGRVGVYYPQTPADDTRRFEELAARIAAYLRGSDDHGSINEGRLMGRIRLPYVPRREALHSHRRASEHRTRFRPNGQSS